MMKILACLCLLLGSCGFGCMKVREYRKHCDELNYIRYILNTMLIETENHRGTFGETCLAVASKLKEPYKDFFLGLYNLLEKERMETPHIYWEKKIEELSGHLALTKDEISILRDVIRCADATTLMMPLELLRQSMVEWDKAIISAEKVRMERSKVTLCLSISVGLLLCITII